MNTIYNKILLVPIVLVLGLLCLTGVSAALSFSGLPDVTFNEDATATLNLNTYVSGANGTVTYTYSGNTNVKVSIASGIATFSANSNVNVINGETITFTATDQTPEQKSDNIVVKINALNDAPTLTIADQIKIKIGSAYNLAVTATDPDVATNGDTLTFNYTTDWDTFSMSNAGQISFTPTDEDYGVHDVTITVKDSAGASASDTVRFIVTDDTDDGSLTISDVKVDDVTGDDTSTAPGDNLEIEFDLNDKISQDMSSISIEAWLEDSNGDRLGDKFEPDDTYDVDAKKSQIVKFEMGTSPEAESKTYNLMIRAEGENEDGDTKSVLYTEEVRVTRETHDMFIEAISVTPNPVECGGPAEFAIKVWNVGKTSEDDVHVKILNSGLGINTDTGKYAVDKSGSDADVSIIVDVNIPSSAKAAYYPIDFVVWYDGDKYSDKQTALLQVSCGSTTATTDNETTVPAGTGTISLAQSAVSADIGQAVKFTAVLSNTESTDVNYKLAITGAADWAEASVEPADVTLAPGTSIPVYIYLTPKAGSYGKEDATLTITSGTTVVASKTVTVNLPEKPTTIVTPGTGIANPLTVKLGNITLDTNDLVLIAFVAALAMFGLGLAMRFKAGKAEKKK